MAQRIQSILFSKKNYTPERARRWLSDHNLNSGSMEEGGESAAFLCFRQFDPGDCSGSFQQLTENFPAGIQAVACNVGKAADCGCGPLGAGEIFLLEASGLLEVSEIIKQEGAEWCIYTKDGSRKLSCHASEAEAKHRLIQIEFFKSQESSRSLATSALSLSEAQFDSEKHELRLTVIKPGMNLSKTRNYKAEVLKRDYKIFEGAKMFADHLTRSEARERPEGSIRNWVASLREVAPLEDGRIQGRAVIVDPEFETKIRRLAEHKLLGEMGVSIRAVAEARQETVDDHPVDVVERLVRCRSVDFVTFPGAGGQVEALESAREEEEHDVDLVSLETLRERRPELVELIEAAAGEKGGEPMTEVEKLKSDLAAKEAELQKANERATQAETKEAQARKTVFEALRDKLLAESKLPEKARERVKVLLKEPVEEKAIREAIEAEEKYLAEVAPGRVKNMGGQPGGTPDEVNLVESFKELGLSEAEAKLAAAGR